MLMIHKMLEHTQSNLTDTIFEDESVLEIMIDRVDENILDCIARMKRILKAADIDDLTD